MAHKYMNIEKFFHCRNECKSMNAEQYKEHRLKTLNLINHGSQHSAKPIYCHGISLVSG